MAVTADIDVDRRQGRPNLEGIAAGTTDRRDRVIRVNLSLHRTLRIALYLYRCQARKYNGDIDLGATSVRPV